MPPWYLLAGWLFGGGIAVVGLVQLLLCIYEVLTGRGDDIAWPRVIALAVLALSAWFWLPFLLCGIHRAAMWTMATFTGPTGAEAVP